MRATVLRLWLSFPYWHLARLYLARFCITYQIMSSPNSGSCRGLEKELVRQVIRTCFFHEAIQTIIKRMFEHWAQKLKFWSVLLVQVRSKTSPLPAFSKKWTTTLWFAFKIALNDLQHSLSVVQQTNTASLTHQPSSLISNALNRPV